MRNKSLKLLIATITPISLATSFGLQSLSSCSQKNDDVEIFTIKGIVKDTDGNALENVTVECNDKTTKTDASGNFIIECERPSSVIYFEKDEYLPTALNEYSYDKALEVVLTPLDKTTPKPIAFKLVDMQNNIIPNCSLSIFPLGSDYFKHFITASDGTCATTINVANTGNTMIPFTINNSLYDGQQQILSVDLSTSEVTLIAKPYQYDIKAYVNNKNAKKHIIMHAYHVKSNDESSLKVSFEANFAHAFTSTTKYTLTFHVGDVQSSPNQPKIVEDDFAIQFNSSKVIKTYGDVVKGKDKNLVKVKLNKNKAYLDVIIPSSFYDLESKGTIGIHLAGSGGSFQPFDHKDASTKASNQLCHIRLDEDNKYYQASDNCNPFGSLDWDTTTGADWIITKLPGEDYLGEIGPRFNFGYKLKIAKNRIRDHGIYLLTKYQQDQMSHFLPDSYQPHFFFDIHEYSTDYPDLSKQPSNDGKVIHYSPFSGYWMKKYTVTSPEAACDDPKDYDEFYKQDGVQIYSKEDLMITYIPYAALGITPNDRFGFACNLYYHYTGGEWFAWNGENPTGFKGTSKIKAIPHFEHLVSYIRFDSTLSIIPYPA